MRFLIFAASAFPPALAASCWWHCECEGICSAADAIACLALAIVVGLVFHVVASIAFELHLLSR